MTHVNKGRLGEQNNSPQLPPPTTSLNLSMIWRKAKNDNRNLQHNSKPRRSKHVLWWAARVLCMLCIFSLLRIFISLCIHMFFSLCFLLSSIDISEGRHIKFHEQQKTSKFLSCHFRNSILFHLFASSLVTKSETYSNNATADEIFRIFCSKSFFSYKRIGPQ